MEGVGGCGVSSVEPEARCFPSCPCQLSTTPPTQSPLCDSFNLEPRGFYKATKQGHFSLRLLACPEWYFQAPPPPPMAKARNPILSMTPQFLWHPQTLAAGACF